MGFNPGGRFTATNATLFLLIEQAYRVQHFQIIGGPSWINADRFDVEGKTETGLLPVPPAVSDITNPDVPVLMLQSLLEDRFQLRLHHETRDLPEYILEIGKDGTRLKEVGGPPQGISIGGGMIYGKATPFSLFVPILSQQVRRPVIDRTGLNGYYEIILEYSEPSVMADGRASAPALESDEILPINLAIQEQLGLKLESTKGPVEVLVIDSVQKPSEN
jgi:uncharacterized protein (TIGR03435 family)